MSFSSENRISGMNKPVREDHIMLFIALKIFRLLVKGLSLKIQECIHNREMFLNYACRDRW